MSLTTHITKAGKYPVVQIACPYFKNEFVKTDSPRTGILHTTEGGWNGSMEVFHTHFAPHFLLGVNATLTAHQRVEHAKEKLSLDKGTPPEPTGKVEIAQLVPVGNIGAAIVTHNNLAIVQIEMIGYAREELWLPTDETLDALASLMLVCKDVWGIPLSRPWPTGVYGRAGKTDHRNDGHFGKTAGWFGHGDCPTPDTHWDPGNLNWDVVFFHANTLEKSSNDKK